MAINRLIRPGVQIQQKFLTTNPALSNPELPTVVVGPCVQIVRDALGGEYNKDLLGVGTPFQIAYPTLEDGAIVNQRSVRLSLTNIVLEVFDTDRKATLSSDKMVLDTSVVSVVDFIGQDVQPGDRVELEKSTASGLVKYDARVVKVDSGTQLTLDKDLSTAFSGLVDFRILRSHGSVLLPQDEVSLESQVNQKVVRTVLEGGATARVSASGSEVRLTPNADGDNFLTKGVEKGDVLKVVANQTTIKATVAADPTDGLRLTVDRNLEELAGTGPLTFLIERIHEHTFSTIADVSADTVTISNGLQLDGIPVKTATVRVSFDALRTAIANQLITIDKVADITEKLVLGTSADLHPRNPLAVGAFLAKQNTVTSVLALPIADDSPLGWQDALDRLENESVYTIVCLTDDPTVSRMVRTHVQGMSTKEKSKFRIGFVTLPHPVQANVVDTQASAVFRRSTTGTGRVVSLVAPDAAFKTDNVRPGDFVKLVVNEATTTDVELAERVAAAPFFKVTAVPNNTTLTLVDARFAQVRPGVFAQAGFILTNIDGTENTADFNNKFDATVERVLNKDDQALAIAQVASSMNERRITYITNSEVVVNIRQDADGNYVDDVLPGWALAAAFGGMNAGFPPHQGFTNLGVVGIKRVRFGNKYFSDSQLGLIGGSGGFVVVQDTEGSLPAAWLQTTTDNSSIQRRELSVTKTLDYYSLGLFSLLSGYIGTHNIYGGTIASLTNAVNSYHAFLQNQSYDKIGAPILSALIGELREHEVLPDTVVLATQIDIPIPLNYITATVEVVA